MSEFRRGLMMGIINGSDEWLNTLISMNCVFYAPMNKEGDLTDHITGIAGYPYSFNSSSMPSDNLTWSSENNAYLLHAKYGGENAITFPLTNLINRVPGNNISWVATVKKANLNKFCYVFYIGLGHPYPIDKGWSLQHWYNKVTLSDQEFITLIVILDYDNKKTKLYINNQLYSDTTTASSYNGFKPNWQTSWYNNITINGIGGTGESNSLFEGQAYFKECSLFNKVLSEQEIQTIVIHNNYS